MSIGFQNHKRGNTVYSSSRWESSFFGGYYNLIFDHPDVQLNYKVDLDVKGSMGLPYYASEKLAKIFLLRVKELELVDYLLTNAKIVQKTKYWQTKTVFAVDPKDLKYVYDIVVSHSPEHRALFEHYRKLLLDLEISMPAPPPPPPPSSGGEKAKGSRRKKRKGQKGLAKRKIQRRKKQRRKIR